MQLNETEALFRQAAKKAQEAFNNCTTQDDLVSVLDEWNSFKAEFSKLYTFTNTIDGINEEVRTALAAQCEVIEHNNKRKQLEDVFSNFYGNIAKWINSNSQN